MNKYLGLLGLIFTTASPAFAQNTYLRPGSDEYHLLNRLETKSGILSDNLFLNTIPVSRKDAVEFLMEEKSNFYNSDLSNIDNYNINRALSISGEWARNGDGAADSRRSWAGVFYNKESDFVHINTNDFFLVANPIFSIQGGWEKDNDRGILVNSSQGLELRSRVKNFLGLYFAFTHNYEEPPIFARNLYDQWAAIPGAGTFKRTQNGYSYWNFRGYADVALLKDHISLTLGYDQHFIGDGFRSLFLSDFANGAAFARLNTKIWKLNYQNLYLVLKPQSFAGEPATTGYKYAAAHYLSLNVTRWLNIGLFETVTFSRQGHFEFGYLNPVIFYRAIERSMGSPDKVAVGINAKALVLRRLNIYGQFLLNEMTSSELFGGNGYWANKFGAQLGVKYYDVAGIRNLDLQAEGNIIRPYTYQHYENAEGGSLANFSHFNQPLAHPLGAGLAEVIATINYQPMPRLAINARLMYYAQGIDTAGSNNGSNIFKDYQTRSASYGVKLIHGPEAQCLSAGLRASYELRPRLYIDLSGLYRHYVVENNLLPETKTLFLSAGLRLNINAREYNQF